ncbi:MULTISPECIES: DUF732 domain-containing protein [Mycobacteriaceae]|uniref:DUF732 domain-containing protein n=1 Tax=Mycobacteriaceae TaxID=1762 RepID=UPI000DCEC08C|nr:DUF732 domain-containing protein [Mycolicibacter senuensis]RAU99936.1 DUF732 domain-containing protein [Mycolicibacter senuensis]
MAKRIPVWAVAAFAVLSAAPAQADPEGAGDPGFLAALRQSGMTFAGDAQAIAAGRAVCGLISNGESGLQVVKELQNDNAALTLDGAAQFAVIAASAYCPGQLTGSKR